MAKQDDIKLIIEQEKALVFSNFDEAAAYEIGHAIRERALRGGLGIVADVRTWGRPLYYMALPGTTGDNVDWARRKANVVQRMMKSTYRVVLERSWTEDYFPPRRGLDNMEFVLAGGGFPITVKGAGIIGAICVSGLHERDDHGVVVEVLAERLGVDKTSITLPPL
ncbi:MAG TPA: heme-degrading domain-containing protein [Devosia sp.]|nr:heme-degrading domain-containing protein [Devosia sp.]